MSASRAAILLILSTVIGVILLPGCADDKAKNDLLKPTIENIWPNEDGRFWSYDVTVNTWDDWERIPCDTLSDCDDDPLPLPTWSQIEALLDGHEIPDSMNTMYAVYGLAFMGDTTSMSGATGQNLRESIVLPGQSLLKADRPKVSPLISRLYIARPDLRSAIETNLGLDVAGDPRQGEARRRMLLEACNGPECPLLIHGYVWRKTKDWIGTYGDLDTLVAWKFLEADLSRGHEFTHQLVPLLADDVFLHCKVRGRTHVTTGYQEFKDGLDCMYIVDYGSWTWTGPGGEELGCCRMIDYGRVIYVPEVGPVFGYERVLVALGEPLGPGFGEKFLSLRDTGLPSD